MSVVVSNLSVKDASGGLSSTEDLIAWAYVTNGGGGSLTVAVDFKIDGQSYGVAHGQLGLTQAEWFQMPVGRLAEGTHELDVAVDIDDGTYNSSVDSGNTFVVPGAGQAAGGGHVQAPGGFAIVDAGGDVRVPNVAVREVTRAGDLDDLGWVARQAINETLREGFPAFKLGIEYANAYGWTIALGLDGDIAGILGLTSGAGIYFGPDDAMGLFTSIGADLGFIIGGSIEVAMTFVQGGPDRLAGECFAAEAGGGELIVASGSVLWDMHGDFLGWAGEVGVGFGLPISVFASYSTTKLWKF